jgi:hypothetical protein
MYSRRLDICFEGQKKAKPKQIICGKEPFEIHEQGPEIRRELERLMDAAVNLMDAMQEENYYFPFPFFLKPHRNETYGQEVLQEYFYAKSCRVEWLTVQIKCLNKGDVTKEHKNKSNCTWVGYNVTGALSFIFRDVFGIFWSMKIFINWRKNIRQHCMQT